MLSSRVKHFIFRLEQPTPFSYLAGQFMTIHFENNGKSLKRSYSIANAPQKDNRIEFAAGYVEGGPGTDLLFNLAPGDTLNITGPFGRLILKDESPKRYLLLGTSTGITPYRAMFHALQQRMRNHPELQVVILQGVRKHDDILYLNDFLAFMHENPRVTFRACLSQQSTDLQEYERHGFVQHAFSDLSLNPAHDVVYLCGNPSMIDDSFHHLKERGFDMHQIIREKYISAGTKA